jgi:molecular chaperone DnaK
MRRVLVAYCDSDRAIAGKLARELDRAGLGVWFDEWDIQVGDSILEKTNNALETNDGLVVVLSPSSLKSELLLKQLNAATMMELNDKRITVLPAMVADCTLPPLLKDKKVADFRIDYRTGLTQLLCAIAPEMMGQRLKREGSGIIGIDFGTGTSLLATIEDGRPVIIPNRLGQRITPSIVAMTSEGEWLVGEPAAAQAEANPLRTFYSIKRYFGTGFVAEINGTKFKAWQLAGIILRHLREDAEAYLGRKVKGAVLGCPAYFDHYERMDLLRAVEFAEIPVIRLLAEPSAAILANGLHLRVEINATHNVMVYDLGAGSFDVSIASVGGGIVEILSVYGDTRLGGDDFDAVIANWSQARFKEARGIEIREERVKRRILTAAERAKVALSSTSVATMFVSNVAVDPANNQWLDLIEKISLKDYERLAKPLVSRTIECCEMAIHFLGNNSYYKLNSIVLSGLPTRTPLVRQKVRDTFGIVPMTRIDPDEAVALGAALQASIAVGGSNNELLLDVAPYSIGIRVGEDEFAPLILGNTTIPIRKWDAFAAIRDDAKNDINISVFEGNEAKCSKNRYIGELIIHIDDAGLAKCEFVVELNIDVNSKRSFKIMSPAGPVKCREEWGNIQPDVNAVLELAAEESEIIKWMMLKDRGNGIPWKRVKLPTHDVR